MIWTIALSGSVAVVHGQQPKIYFPAVDQSESVIVSAAEAQRWRQGQVDLWHFRGNVEVHQGAQQVSADQMVMWADLDDPDQVKRLIIYAEGNAVAQWNASGRDADRIVDDTWFGRLFTKGTLDLRAPLTSGAAELPDIIARAQAAHTGKSENISASLTPRESVPEPNPISPPTSAPTTAGSPMISPQTGAIFAPPQSVPPVSQAPPAPQRSGPPPLTRLEIHPRQSSVPLNLKTIPSDIPGEQILVASGGVRITIDSRELAQRPELAGETSSQVFILADNVVAWSNALDPSLPNAENARWEVYLEGNVVFTVGRRTIYADRMYYDATYKRGTILRAEFYTPTNVYKGLVRLKADVLQQLDDNSFQAFGAALTSSRLGVPRYWLQSDRLSLEGSPTADIDPATGVAAINPQTGLAATRDEYFVESQGNRVYLANVPVFYWPNFRTSLDNPRSYVESIKVGSDRIFGTQVRARFDMYQLFGFRNRVPGTNWISSVDYLSERGLGLGSDYDYKLSSLFGIPGDVEGRYRSWFINDSGLDNLGADRRTDPLYESLRGMMFLNHRQRFRPGFQLEAELGYLSDRNFLEQYYQQEWDWNKDMTTGLQLERLDGNQSWDLWGQARINDFFTQTTWAPRFDHHILGQSLLADRLVYFAHSQIGYGRFRPAEAPTNAEDLASWVPLAWESAPASGIRAGTRQELDLPLNLGPLKFVPFILGDATYWQQDLNGNDEFRVYGQTGARVSLPFWRVDPTIQSTLFNVNGLAHKVTLNAEFAYADASENFDQLPLYDPLDDDAQEFFRRRYAAYSFGIVPPANIPIEFLKSDVETLQESLNDIEKQREGALVEKSAVNNNVKIMDPRFIAV